nr:hypothetical protein CFP56_60625 [Quercus suber]
MAPKNALAVMEELDGPIFQLALVTVGSEELDELRVRPNLKVQILPILQKSKRKVRLVGEVWVRGVMTGKEESNEKEEVQEGAELMWSDLIKTSHDL